MNALLSILKAAHCRSTHHYFAVDALTHVTTTRGKQLGDLLLKYHHEYLTGAKDPDKKFRDFRNHVVHVKDGYWGGAPKAAERWREKLLDCIKHKQWPQAAYAAGVLSHYFTDPLMPLHTAQSSIESIVHRPMEWSVCKSYSMIHNRWQEGEHKIVFRLASKPDWISAAIRRGAEVANRSYNELIARYRLKEGARNPKLGLDKESINLLAGIFGIAITGWARVLERIADESQSDFPSVSLMPQTLLASIKIPIAWVIRNIESHQEQQAVRALVREYNTTGTVVENLPTEVKSVRHERENDERKQPVIAQNTSPSAIPKAAAEPAAPDSIGELRPTENRTEKTHDLPRKPSTQTRHQRRQPRLKLGDKIVDAPSIGRKTAKRFHEIGIETVGQFLLTSPSEMENSLNTKWIRQQLLVEWQAQAQLVCAIPSLCGYKAQLLVALDVNTPADLAAQETTDLSGRIVELVQTSAGKRIIRSSKTPQAKDVQLWIDDAVEVAAMKRIA